MVIFNLINTLAISTSLAVSVNNTNFKNEKQPNRTTYAETDYTGEMTASETQYWADLNASNPNAYIEGWGVHSINYTGNASSYLNISSYWSAVQSYNSNGLYLHAQSRIVDTKMSIRNYDYNNTSNMYTLPTMYFAFNINPANINKEVVFNLSITKPEINGTRKGIKYLMFTTTEKVEGSFDESYYNREYGQAVIDKVYSGNNYTKNLQAGIQEYTGTGLMDINFNVPLNANTRNYVYILLQPVKIVDDYPIVSGVKYTSYLDTTKAFNYDNGNNHNVEVINQSVTNLNTELNLNGINVPQQEIEVVDIGGVMFQVLGMPFTFISTAFDLTLFPNTPYQINISTLFLSIFAVIVFVFIIKMILGAIGHK